MPSPVPALPEELLEKILFLIPPNYPAILFRASLVCRPWRTLLTDPAFGRRRYRKFHGAPPLLGFFAEDSTHGGWFNSLSPTSPLPPVHPGRRKLSPLDCRHGRVLFADLDEHGAPESFVVWDSIGRRRWELPHPKIYANSSTVYNLAVLCAANGCNHLDCYGGPFLVAFVCTDDEQGVTYACIYSSEARSWSPISSCQHPDEFIGMEPDELEVTNKSKVLVGNTLYLGFTRSEFILRYDLASQDLSMIGVPSDWMFPNYILMTTEAGVLGLAYVDIRKRLCVRLMETGPDGTVTWAAYHRVIKLQELLPPRDFAETFSVIGFAEGVGVIFFSTDACVFAFELKSGQVKKVLTGREFFAIPYMSFYTPDQVGGIKPPSPIAFSIENIEAAQEEHHVSQLSQPSREASFEEGKWEKDATEEEERGNEGEQSLDQAQELFNKGSKAIDEGDVAFAINCLNRALKIRVSHCGRLAPSCVNAYYEYGYALLCESHAPYSKTSSDGAEELLRAWKMFHIARAILEKSPGSTVEKVQIFSALAIVSMENEEIGCSLSFCSKALTTLKHLVDPDLLQIVQLNLYVCLALVFVSRFGYFNPYCAKTVILCKSRVQNMENADAAGEGGSEKPSLDDEMEFLTDLKKTLEGVEQAMSTSTTSASGEPNGGNAIVPTAASFSCSQWLDHDLAWTFVGDLTETIPKILREMTQHVSEVVATCLTL